MFFVALFLNISIVLAPPVYEVHTHFLYCQKYNIYVYIIFMHFWYISPLNSQGYLYCYLLNRYSVSGIYSTIWNDMDVFCIVHHYICIVPIDVYFSIVVQYWYSYKHNLKDVCWTGNNRSDSLIIWFLKIIIHIYWRLKSHFLTESQLKMYQT